MRPAIGPAIGSALGFRSGIPFVDRLADHGDRPALVEGTRTGPDGAPLVLDYATLAERVTRAAAELGAVRRLVLLEACNTVDCLVGYLGALAGGHVVLVAPGGAARDRLVQRYDPDVVAGPELTVGPHRAGWAVRERRVGTAHTLHPELSLLLGTSGSAGSPKLVRLSAAGIAANAGAIADTLGIRPDDRAVTTLPPSYCYGLSVLHSHLLRGASVVVGELSVLSEEFWALLADGGVTTLAGVPYTFDLLDRAGFADRPAPTLRLVTQAGGRLAPDRVRGYAELGRTRGWDLVVMYGQTEATARMACLPPALAASRPEAVGLPVPGGSFRIAPPPDGGPDAGVGEIVYTGPNVMLGYAHGPADLALGRTVHELRTGDLGRIAPDGLLEVTGRCSAVVKVAGLRIDLDHVEAELAGLGLVGCAVAADGPAGDVLGVAVEGCAHPSMVRSLLATELGLPPAALRVVAVETLPRRDNGKPDRPAVRALLGESTGQATGRPAPAPPPGPPAPGSGDRLDRLVALYAELLDAPDVGPSSTFAGLGGDSLSYVALSLRLEDELGTLPADWPTATIAELAGQGGRRSRWARVETGVLLRALAIVAVVGTHAGLFTVRGGAHLLLAVAGFNAARFTFTAPTVRDHLRRCGQAVARVAVPTVVWVSALAVVGVYPWTSAVFLNSLLGPDRWTPAWHFWFVEALVWILLVTAGLLCLPVLRRVRAAAPFGVALGAVAVGLAPRFDLVHVWTGPERGTPQYVFWLFAIGWAAAEARTRTHRVLLTAVTLAAVPGFFGNGTRELVVAAGVLALLWLRTVPLPRAVTPLVGTLAAASLYIYLTQWQVYPALDGVPLLALLGSLLVGVIAWSVAERLRRLISPTRRPTRLPTRPGDASSRPDPRRSPVKYRTLPVLAATLAVLLTAGCGGGAEAEPPLDPNKLTVYSSQHDNLTQAWVDAFTEETGIDVQVRYGKDASMGNQIVQEGQRSPADVFLTENSPAMTIVQDAGLFAPLDAATLAQVPAGMKPSDGQWVGAAARATVLVYNPAKLPADQLPRSLMDLADPSWAGRWGAGATGADFQAIVGAVLATQGEQRAAAWLAALKANAKIYQNNIATMKAVNAGEVPAGVIFHYYWYRDQAKTKEGTANTRLHFFGGQDPGAFVSVSGAGVLKSSKHAADAQRFVAFVTGPAGQKILADSDAMEYPVGSGVAANPALTPLSELDPPTIDPATLNGPKVVELMTDAGIL